MKHFFLLWMLMPIFMMAQIQDDFQDGNISHNPLWTGDVSHFEVDSSIQKRLHLNAPKIANTSYISSSFSAVDDASWRFYVRLDFNPSSSNYMKIFLMSSKSDLTASLKGYYLMIGGVNDALSLYHQNGDVHAKIIEGPEGMLSQNINDLYVQVTRSFAGEFKLYVDTVLNGSFMLLGSTTDLRVTTSAFFGVQCVYTATRADKFYMDDIDIHGSIPIDVQKPDVQDFSVLNDSTLLIHWNEEVLFNISNFNVSPGNLYPANLFWSENDEMHLIFSTSFSHSILYELHVQGITDLAGNMIDTAFFFNNPDSPKPGDVVLNEVLFYPNDGYYDFIELYNTSDRFLQMNGCFLANAKNGLVDQKKEITSTWVLAPNDYMVLTKDMLALQESYPSSLLEQTLELPVLPTYSMDQGTVVVLNADHVLLDSLHYKEEMHSDFLQTTQGVSLERISLDVSTNQVDNWQSASETVGFSTPGYKNSQAIDIHATQEYLHLPKPYFSPNNDGVDDILEIAYHLPSGGYTAHVSVFNLNGQWVKDIIELEFVGVGGTCFWDGDYQDSAFLPDGVYIVVADFMDAKGNTIQEKEAFGLLSR